MTATAAPIDPQLVIPYTLDANDMRFATAPGFNSGDEFFPYLKDSFDTLYAEGRAGRAPMMSVGLHCRLVGRPGRVAGLKRFIDYVKGHDKVWVARRIDIADHWRAHHPYEAPALRPSRMERDGVRRALRRHLRAFAVDRRARLRRSNSARPTTAPAACTTRSAAPSAAPRPTNAWACSRPIPTLPASSPPPGA